MDLKMNKKIIVGIGILGVLFAGCGSPAEPTSKVGIINGKYALQTEVPNNNKGKKVPIIPGQSYNCAKINTNGKIYSFDLNYYIEDKSLLTYDHTLDGKKLKGRGATRFEYKPNEGFVATETTENTIIMISQNESQIELFNNKKNRGAKTGSMFQCTQTTNYPQTVTRYLANHEISEYQPQETKERTVSQILH